MNSNHYYPQQKTNNKNCKNGRSRKTEQNKKKNVICNKNVLRMKTVSLVDGEYEQIDCTNFGADNRNEKLTEKNYVC